MQDRTRVPRTLKIVIAIAIAFGIFFRFFHLDRKVYWFDEVYSTMRMAGYSIQEVDKALFQNQIISAPTLQNYQQPKPNSTIADTIDVLIQEDAKHPPLYYSLGHFWMRQFGSSIAVSRTLPAAISLFALPLMFALALELFSSYLVASLATVAIALSPFDILFAQTVRQYSLLTVIILASGLFLLRAMRLRRWQTWGWYTLTCAMGLYTHLFFGLTLLGHGVYVIGQQFIRLKTPTDRYRQPRFFLPYLLAMTGSIWLYLPWILAFLLGGDRTFESSNWVKKSVGFVHLLKGWIFSFSSLFVDLDLGFHRSATYILGLPFIILIIIALDRVWKRNTYGVSGFVLTSILVPFLALALPDLILGGQRSAIARYLICSFPGIQLAVAYLLGTYLLRRRIWQGIWAAILTASLVSGVVSAYSLTWWSKGVSYPNATTASVLNGLDTPLVISDRGDDYLNQGNLISLSYRLEPDVELLLIEYDAIDRGLASAPHLEDREVLFYSPSKRLRSEVEAKWGLLARINPHDMNLFRLEESQLGDRAVSSAMILHLLN